MPKSPPDAQVLERHILYAVARMAKYYGRGRTANYIATLHRQMAQGNSALAVTMDLEHMEETL